MLSVYSRSPALVFALVGPLAAYQFSMPAKYRFGLEYADEILQLICWSLGNLFQFGNQNRQRHLFDPAWFYGFIAFALENGQLLA